MTTQPRPAGRRPQLTSSRRSHHPQYQSPLPGWQAAGAGEVPGGQYGDRFRRREQRVADPALPASQTEGQNSPASSS